MIYAERVTVSPENIAHKPGEWYYGARAEVRPSYATCDCVYWRSSDPSVASVNKEMGYIYARSAGHAVITAEAADGGFTATCNVSILYCGGKDYRDLSKHIMKLWCDAYYRCTNCGYTKNRHRYKTKVFLAMRIIIRSDQRICHCLITFSLNTVQS